MEALTQLLNYCATHPHAVIWYQASNMVLWTQSDASYLTAPKGRSCAAGYCFLSSQPTKAPTALDEPPPNNGPVHVLCQIMKQVVASTAEAELGALFLNAQAICPFHIALEELRHLQPATPLQTNNSMASGITNDTVKQKHSKAIDMCFYWVCNCMRQGRFLFFGVPETAIKLITSQSTITPPIIKLCDQCISICHHRPPITMHVWSHSPFLHIL